MRIPHTLRTLANFFSTFGFGFFQASIEYPVSVIDLFNQYPSNMRSKNIFIN